MADPARLDPVAVATGLARTLQAAGVEAGPDRVAAFVAALALLDPARRSDVYWAGRVTLCAGPEDLACYDRVFDAYFRSGPPAAPGRTREPARSGSPLRLVTTGEGTGEPPGSRPGQPHVAASPLERLRQRDIATLTEAEGDELARLLAAFRLPGELRRTRRRRPAGRGDLDPRRTVRATLRAGGEPPRLLRRARRSRPRRVVLLVDVSGSMSRYADALLRFAHAAGRRSAGTEVFTLGTRLTRVTRELAGRDPDLAMAALSAAVPDWAGGTRLGVGLRTFLRTHGRRGLARGATVVLLSDGWERGDAALLGGEMARLHRLAHRVVWANPRAGRRGFEPVAAGLVAALPHVDAFVPGHSLAALEELAAIVSGRAPAGRVRGA